MFIERPELKLLTQAGYEFDQPWQIVDIFETKIAEFFGARYAVAVDSCTHALELSLVLLNQFEVNVEIPVQTYMSIPMMLTKIRQPWHFVNRKWTDYYSLNPLPVIDAAFMWQRNSYVPDTLTSISFQFKKQLAIGRGGAILTNDKEYYCRLQRMCRDGRDREILQQHDDILEIGYHYYMTPEDAARGILLFDQLHNQPVISRSSDQYKILTDYSVYKNYQVD